MPNSQNIESPVLIIGPGRTASSYVVSHLQHSAGGFQEMIENDVYRVLYKNFRESWWTKDWHWMCDDKAEVDRRIQTAIHGAFLQLFPSDLPRWSMKMIWSGHDPEAVDFLFPKARFLHLTRDPRTNIPSVMERIGWSRKEAESQYVAANDNAVLFERFGDRYLRVRQEDFVTEREGTWRKICTFLDTPFVEDANWAAEVNVSQSQKGKVDAKREDNRLKWKALPKDVQKTAESLGYGDD